MSHGNLAPVCSEPLCCIASSFISLMESSGSRPLAWAHSTLQSSLTWPATYKMLPLTHFPTTCLSNRVAAPGRPLGLWLPTYSRLSSQIYSLWQWDLCWCMCVFSNDCLQLLAFCPNISCHTGVLSINSFRLCLPGDVCILFSFL